MAPQHLPLLLCLILLSLTAQLAHMCNMSAPELTLNQLHSGCNTDLKARHSDCVRATHRFCELTVGVRSLGVSREIGDNRISVSCVRSHHVVDVPLQDLTKLDKGCSSLKLSQHRDCLAATFRYCKNRYGKDFAGIIQNVWRSFQVHCFKSAHKERVPLRILQDIVPSCKSENSHSSACFSAASRFCQKYFGYSGGITQDVDKSGIAVACYNAEFSGDVFTQRTNDFYAARNKATKVCSLKYQLDKTDTLKTTPDVLKMEMYDNSNSDVTLESSFELSKDVTETSRFESSQSVHVGVETSFKTGVPFIAEGEIKVTTSLTLDFVQSKEMSTTKRYVQHSTVSVPPGKKIIKEARVTRSEMKVPWSAVVVNGLGAVKTISGDWYGVTTFDLQITQRNAN